MADNIRNAQAVSKKLTESGLQAVTLIIQKNSLQLCGDASMIDSIVGDPELYKSLEAKLGHLDKQYKYKTFPSFPLLFANPDSKDWKGISSLREQVSTYLHCLGYGKGMRAFGSGVAPKGWPSEILNWANFKGPKRSFGAEDCKVLLKSILEAHNIDFATYGPKKHQDDDFVEEEDTDSEAALLPNEDNEEGTVEEEETLANVEKKERSKKTTTKTKQPAAPAAGGGGQNQVQQ